MLIDFKTCVIALNRLKLPVRGILHLGAHVCDEKGDYNAEGVADSKIVWIEGNPILVDKLKEHGFQNVYHALIDQVERTVPFYIANNMQSSSLLEFGTHSEHHGHVFYHGAIRQDTTTLKNFIENNKIDMKDLNFWNFDIQGVELRALKSAGDYIKYADAIYLEVNYEEVYKNCDKIYDIDEYLLGKGFYRLDTKFCHPCGWGDALYVRKQLVKRYESTTQGEYVFLNRIKENLKVVFDVGSRDETEFIDLPCEVHYFDPVPRYIENLKMLPNKNTKSYFNIFGLGEKTETSYFYPEFSSFYDRIKSCGKSDEKNKCLLEIKKSKEYMIENNISEIDFLKIDTEGFEFKVLKGFEDILQNVKYIQFEYGGTFLDNETRLVEVTDYLEKLGFHKFSLLTDSGPVLMTDFTDNYQYCNIVCVNKKYNVDF
jgi:FkbM family methyltransferase